jgi:poly(3-hydroxybutyrate) depolymerase
VLAFLTLAVLLVLIAPEQARGATALTGQHRTLASGRTYWLNNATGLDSGDRLVIGLSGTSHSAQNANETFWVTGDPATTGWQRHAVLRSYSLALADSVAGEWNVGGGWAGGSQDDVSYLVALVADATAVHGEPYAEVYIAGFSAGGAMAWRAVADRPDVFTACGMASGWASYYPSHTMDCWHVHGTTDTTVPIRGGAGIRGFVFPPAFQEESRSPRGSRAIMEATGGNHSVTGWMAERLWTEWTIGSLS